MKEVEIRYNPYRYRFAYYIDGKAMCFLSNQKSNILPKQERPFHTWAPDIFNALDNDINQNYELIFTGREVEGEILKQYQRGSQYCKGVQIRPYTITASTAERMRELEDICRRESVKIFVAENLMVYTDDTECARQENIEQYWPNNTLYHGTIEYHDIAELNTAQGNFALVLLYHHQSDTLNINQLKFGRVYCIGVCPQQTAMTCRHNSYSIDVPQEYVGELIALFMDYEPLPYLLNLAIEKCIEFVEDKQAVYLLQEIDYLLMVQPIPENQDGMSFLEENQTLVPEIICIPKQKKEPEVWFESNDSRIIRAEGKKLIGVSEGTCRIIAREAGISTPLYDREVCCIHRNRIKEIHVSKRYVQTGLNSRIQPEFSIVPEDADNKDMIRMIVSDPNKAVVDRENNLIASSMGKCTVKIEAEGIYDTFELDILPQMQAYQLRPKKLDMTEGQSREIGIGIEPANAYFTSYTVRIEPDNDIVQYDDAQRCVYAIRPGRAAIVFESEDKEVSARLPVKVWGRKTREMMKAAALAVAGIALIVIVAKLLF